MNPQKKDPTKPILYYGNLKSNVCFFGRDLGRDEVMAGQPLIGASGTLVRQGFYRAIYKENTSDRDKLMAVCDRLLLTNTVPYKPPENKAYGVRVKKKISSLCRTTTNYPLARKSYYHPRHRSI